MNNIINPFICDFFKPLSFYAHILCFEHQDFAVIGMDLGLFPLHPSPKSFGL